MHYLIFHYYLQMCLFLLDILKVHYIVDPRFVSQENKRKIILISYCISQNCIFRDNIYFLTSELQVSEKEILSQTSHYSNSVGNNCKSLTALYELSGARNRPGCDYMWEVRVEHHFLSHVFSCLVIKRNGKSNVSSFNLLFHYFVVSLVICFGFKITVIFCC